MAKEKSHQKKFDTRIDFTPMVDMNMLLITFFMLCTTMLKSQTLQIALPSNSDNITENDQQQAAESQAITIIIDGNETTDAQGNPMSNPADAKFYYYEGQLDLNNPESFQESNMKSKGEGTLRYIFQQKNKEALKLINEQKAKWQRGEITDSVYQELAKQIRSNNDIKQPIVMIKPTGRASYSDVVAVLDEMQINNISRFQLETLSKDDSTALQAKGVTLPPVSANPTKPAIQ